MRIRIALRAVVIAGILGLAVAVGSFRAAQPSQPSASPPPAAPASSSGEKLTEHTFRLGPGAKSPAATIDAMAWLAGHWRGEAFGGQSEEIWSPAAGGSMMGMYRHLVDGRPVFFEFLHLVERDGSLVLRLKHFHADLVGWEEKDRTVDFPLVALEPNTIHFDGMSFHRQGASQVTVYLAIGQGEKGGAMTEETFVYRRQPGS